MDNSNKPEYRSTIGNNVNLWRHSSSAGFDLTHRAGATTEKRQPPLRLRTTTTPVRLDAARTALIIIDMQNYFLSPAFGRQLGPGHAASDRLKEHVIPACRKAGVQIVWLNWGLTEDELHDMPPAVKRVFGFQATLAGSESPRIVSKGPAGTNGDLEERGDSIAIDRFGEPKEGISDSSASKRSAVIHKGLGSQCGSVILPNGQEVDAGRVLMRGTWNAALYPPLHEEYERGLRAERPDVWIHKNRLSGMWGATTPLQDFLEEKGIRTLMFAGVNTDQCVSGTLTDSFSKGFDCILLKDAAGTSSPAFAQQCIEYNVERSYGFVSDCKSLFNAVEEMGI